MLETSSKRIISSSMQGTSYGDLDETNKKTCIHTDPTGLYTITASDERKQSKTAGIKPALSGIKDHSSCKISVDGKGTFKRITSPSYDWKTSDG